MPLDNFYNAQMIWQQKGEKFVKKWEIKFQEARKKGRHPIQCQVTVLEVSMRKMARSNLPELLNPTFLIVICWVSNGNNIILSPKQHDALNKDMRHREELINSIYKDIGLKSDNFEH